MILSSYRVVTLYIKSVNLVSVRLMATRGFVSASVDGVNIPNIQTLEYNPRQ
jgi:hypothetical protein